MQFNNENSVFETIKFYEAFEKWVQFMDAPENALKFLLTPGTVLFFDNYRVLHARTEFQVIFKGFKNWGFIFREVESYGLVTYYAIRFCQK